MQWLLERWQLAEERPDVWVASLVQACYFAEVVLQGSLQLPWSCKLMVVRMDKTAQVLVVTSSQMVWCVVTVSEQACCLLAIWDSWACGQGESRESQACLSQASKLPVVVHLKTCNVKFSLQAVCNAEVPSRG